MHILDILGRPVTTIPPGQRSIIIDEIRATAAGTAAGTSVDLAKLGVRVRNVGAVGDDVLGDFVLRLLQDYGVDASLLRRLPGPTSATILPIRPNGDRPALHVPGANAIFTAADISAAQRGAVASCAAIHLGGLDAMPSLEHEAVAEMVASAHQSGAMVLMDVLRNGDRSSLDRLTPVLRHTDWFCPNEEQLLGLAECSDVLEAARVVLDAGAGGVAVTQGERGCRVINHDVDVSIPAWDIKVVDTTGCGDGFDAGYLTGLLCGLSPESAAWVGTVCGGLVATGLGSDAGITDLAQVLSLLNDAEDDGARAAAGQLGELVKG
ncbi:MAG: carbohydrate kinase family protein [Acidimicrobiales bacterium]